MGVYYTGMSGWDIARQVSAGLVENSDTWKKDALSLLMFAPEDRQQEAMRMVVSGQHTTTPDRLDRVFDLARELPAVHEGELLMCLLDEAFLSLADGNKKGYVLLDWGLDRTEVATRTDLGLATLDKGNAWDCLMDLWKRHYRLYADKDVDNARTWVGTVTGKLVSHGAPLEGVLAKAVAVFEPAHNPGLLLGLLDGGANAQELRQANTTIAPHVEETVRDHPAWKRVLLGELAAERASKTTRRTRRGM